MKNPVILFILCLVWLSAEAQPQFRPAQKERGYTIWQDLTAMENDLLPIQMVVPKMQEPVAEFHIPRIVPGTYDVHNYGRFVHEFTALTKNGDTLPSEKLDINRWKIEDAQRLYKITYLTDDTYDYEENTGIFEPAGTSHSDSVYLLNNFGYIGYIKGHKNEPFELQIKKPQGFYGSTALQGEMTDSLDKFVIADYFTLHDNPLMYCKPDTAWHEVGGAEVLVSVFSPNQLLDAEKALQQITRVLDATADYLGGKLPVEKYAVLIYTIPLDQAGRSYGALEHQTSTVLYMPEMSDERFYSSVKDITSHEFFHIITPLGIHSQYVADFNFIDPEMSEHIWLYEGVTEYSSHVVQVKDSIYTVEEFLDVLAEKLKSSDRYNKYIPLTQASKHTLSFFKDQYLNFYQKGALAAMGLDLKLMQLSEGQYKLIDLLDELGQTYGADTFFVDDQLFPIITEMTYPEVHEFLARHFASAEPLPLQELLLEFGINYQPVVVEEKISIGGFSLSYNFDTERLVVVNTEEMNEFGKEMGFREGDELVEVNGEEINMGNMNQMISQYYQEVEPGDRVKITVARYDDEDEEYEEEKLKARAKLVKVEKEHVFEIIDNPTEKQLKLRKAWLNH